MGLVKVLKYFLLVCFQIFVIGIVLVAIPNLPPYADITQPFSVTPAKPFTGKWSINNRLKDVEKWHKGDFHGPEAFADLNGELYTGIHLGDVVKLTGEHITPVVKFGKPCKSIDEEAICGRPLGLEFDKDGKLFVADAYYGLFEVNVKTGDKKLLVGPNTKIDGKEPKLFNALTIGSDGVIYWTDSSTDFSLVDGMFTLLADPAGRLIQYDPKTKRNKVLLDKLHFANGVALSEDEEFVIVAETMKNRLLRYYLKGHKKGSSDVFIDGLPGMPDNLKSDGKGGFIVPLPLGIDADHPLLFQSLGQFPRVRKALARFLGGIEFVFKKLSEVYPNEISDKIVYMIGSFGTCTVVMNKHRQTLIRLDKNGQIVDSIHSIDGDLLFIAEAHVLKDTLYLGSPFNNYIGRVSLDKIGWGDLKTEKVKRSVPPQPTTTAPKPTTTPRPTTTTPKPTTTTTPKPTTTTPKPTTTTPKPTTTTPKPTTTTPKPTTTTTKPTTTTPKPTTTTPKPTTTTPPPKPTTTAPKPTTPKPATKPEATPTKPKSQPPTVAPPATKPPQPTAAPVKQQAPPTQATTKQPPKAGQQQQTAKN